MYVQISRRSIFAKWVENSKSAKFDAVLEYILEQDPNFRLLSEELIGSIKITIRSTCQKIDQRWTKAGRNLERFLTNNSLWLEENIKFTDAVVAALPNTSESIPHRPGRPQKKFAALGPRAKRQKIRNLVQSISGEELTMAAEMTLRRQGKKDSATIVRELSSGSPQRGTSIKKARASFTQQPAQLSDNEALALIVDANLSTHQYNLIRNQVKNINDKLYPPYYRIKAAKQLCYPPEITITEISAEVKLQSLIDHTLFRLCKLLQEVLESLSLTEHDTLHFVIKWGCDGSQQHRYRQKFSNQNYSDESLFSISLVPLQIYANIENSKKIVWQNRAPSSTRYCRPIKFVFAKESINLINTEVNKIMEQVEKLSQTPIIINNNEVLVKSTLIFCMIDGKVCNTVSSCVSTQTCYLCGAKPREMNNPELIATKVVNQKFFSFRISPLHSYIRFMECILHISYRLEIKTWQARASEGNKLKVAEKKKIVQEKFQKELGLLIDMPKQQAGNSNNGNTARKFFRNAEISAAITGVNVDLIKHFHVILECINCGFPINVHKFDQYAKQTQELYLKEYSWYPMPVSVHKVLFHGSDIIASCILPIGQLSEEAQEARNKDNRQYRELLTRKTSRIDTNTDLMNRLLITSDPLIASFRASPKTKKGKITPEVLMLLEEPCHESKQSKPFSSTDSDSSE